MSKIVLTIEQGADNLPLVDAAFLDSLMRGMARRDPEIHWTLTVDGEAFQPSYRCPRCGRVSYNPNDIAEGYCGACHDYTGIDTSRLS